MTWLIAVTVGAVLIAVITAAHRSWVVDVVCCLVLVAVGIAVGPYVEGVRYVLLSLLRVVF